MNNFRLLAGILSFVLVAGLASPSFADISDLNTNVNESTESSEVATSTSVASPTGGTILSGPGDFSGSETLIGFETLPAVPAVGPFSIGDVTFSEFSSGSGSPGWRLPIGFSSPDPVLTDNAGISLIRMDFATPVNRVGMLVSVSGVYEVRFFDSSLNLIETVPILNNNLFDQGFAGIESPSTISRVEIVEASENGLVGGLDDLRFELDRAVGGELLPIDSAALMLAGLQSSAVWMIPILAGAAGTAVLLVRKRL